MTPDAFKAWRKSQNLNQRKAAEVLGLSVDSIALYEAGMRRDAAQTPVAIPKTVELACAALALGMTSYDGPQQPAAVWSALSLARSQS